MPLVAIPGRRFRVDEHRPFLGRSTLMDSTPLTPGWTYRGCRVRLVGHPLWLRAQPECGPGSDRGSHRAGAPAVSIGTWFLDS